MVDINNFNFAKHMDEAINNMDTYSWSRGANGGLDFGYPQLNEAFEGLSTGLLLVAGAPNTGKSAFVLQMAWQIASANKGKAVCLYFSLDDNVNDLLPRTISLDQKIPINSVSKPQRYSDTPELLAKRSIGLAKLKELSGWFNMVDSRQGSSIEYIERTIDSYHKELENTGLKLVVFIDNFHDVTTENSSANKDSNARYDFIAGKLDSISTVYDVPIICTAEFRKLNGTRRPIVDDVRETTKISYIAKAIILCYNEVGLKGQNADVYYNRPGIQDKFPVLEVHIGKNKFSSFKGRIFYEFIPEYSYLKEVPKAGAQIYLSKLA